MTSEIAKLKEWVDGCDNIVFFGGAGVSTESGIPDFRSVDGLYNQQYKYPPETILSHTFFLSETAEFYRFYRAKMLALDAQPNAAHLKLAEWEREGKCRAVVTQNIDGLHQKAGSKEVLELHGSVLRNYCMRCRKPYPVEKIDLERETEGNSCQLGNILGALLAAGKCQTIGYANRVICLVSDSQLVPSFLSWNNYSIALFHTNVNSFLLK